MIRDVVLPTSMSVEQARRGSSGVGRSNRALEAVRAAPQLERDADRTAEAVLVDNRKASAAPEMLPRTLGASCTTSVAGGGCALPSELREYFEPRCRRDFGAVRLHAGLGPTVEADALDARVFTHGRDIVFGAGEYVPGPREGRRLIAHELAHVARQADAGTTVLQRQAREEGEPDKPPEDEGQGSGRRSTSRRRDDGI